LRGWGGKEEENIEKGPRGGAKIASKNAMCPKKPDKEIVGG